MPPSVLVVEDESDLSQLIGDSLQAAGFQPVMVSTAAEARTRLDGFAYDALVVDLRLPDADGMDVLAAALDRYPDILAVVMTGFGGVDEAVAAIKRGAIDFLIKPFQLAQLARVLQPALESAAAPGRRTPSCARSSATGTASTTSSARAAAMRHGLLDAGARRADEQHGADPGRDRHRQGADRAHDSPQQPARGPALRRVQRRGDPGAAGRSGALRPCEGRVHRRHHEPRRPLRARPPRHALHRRSGA